MSVIILLIVAGGTVAAGFLGAFAWAVLSGQFDDTSTPPIRILFDDSRSTDHPISEGPAHDPSRR
jgi:cbb3-type cytochrome oxidase maturation protein